MDTTDFKILEILQRDGRIPMTQLAQAISMSTPAAIERVKKLEAAQAIIGYRALVRPDRVGKEVNAFVLVSVEQARRAAFYQYVKASDSVIEAYDLAGRYTALLSVSCADMEEFLKTVYDLYAMGTTETYIITDLVKNGIYKRPSDSRADGRPFHSPGKDL